MKISTRQFCGARTPEPVGTSRCVTPKSCVTIASGGSTGAIADTYGGGVRRELCEIGKYCRACGETSEPEPVPGLAVQAKTPINAQSEARCALYRRNVTDGERPTRDQGYCEGPSLHIDEGLRGIAADEGRMHLDLVASEGIDASFPIDCSFNMGAAHLSGDCAIICLTGKRAVQRHGRLERWRRIAGHIRVRDGVAELAAAYRDD